jgi:hypothetical protein
VFALDAVESPAMRRVDALLDQRPSFGALVACFSQRKAPAIAPRLGLLLRLSRRRVTVVADGKDAFRRLACLGQLETVAPGLHAVGFDFQVQTLGIGELVGLVLAFGGAALGIGQQAGLRFIPAFWGGYF